MREVRLEPPEGHRAMRVELRVQAGDRVEPGDIIGVIELDRASQELEAYESMRIVRITPTSRGYHIEGDELETR